MKTKKAVIFDWDGTLCDSLPETFKGTCAVFDNCGVQKPTFADYRMNFRVPFIKFYHDRGVNISSDEIWRIYRSTVDMRRCELFHDVHEALREHHRLGMIQAVISGQTKDVVYFHCQRSGITAFFKEIATDQESKVSAIKAFCARHELDPSQVWFVGDFISDMEDAKVAEVNSIGITRGYQPMWARLHLAGARYCIDHLHALPLLLSD